MKHKWHKEIKAWADGAEIEQRSKQSLNFPDWDYFNGHFDTAPIWEYRIKPQPKEPQYLYVFRTSSNGQTEYKLWVDKDTGGAYIGKIKLENDDVPSNA